MKRVVAVLVISGVCAGSASAQGRPVDWPSYGGDARRTGWERSDTRITKENIKDFQLVLKRKFDKVQAGPRSLTPPVIIGLLISYRGFKELGFVATNSGDLASIDVDLNRIFWQKQLPAGSAKPKGDSSPLCADGLPAAPALTPPTTFGGRRPGARTSTTSAKLPSRLGGTGFGAPRPVYVLTSDGKLHQYNTSDGSDQYPALDFLPPNAKASTLTMNEHVIYTTTSGGCGGVKDGVWAIDLAVEEPPVTSFPISGATVGGMGGVAIGNDGTVYAQTSPGTSEQANTLLALAPRDLKLKHRFTVTENSSGAKKAPDMNVTTPVVFQYKERDLIVSAGIDGRLYLLDSQSLGGADSKTPLYKTPRISVDNPSGTQGIWGGISSWEDEEGVRWVAAPVWGPINPELKAPVTNGATPNGAIVAFKVEEQRGKPVLTPAWVSRDMRSPQPPVITSGAVFAVAAGGYSRQGGQLRPNNAHRAVMYALDAATGKEMYSTGDQVTAPASLTGATVANGRVFFTTTDGTLYAFGVYMEI